MPKYAKTTRKLVIEWANEHLSGDETFTAEPVVQWFAERYPLLSSKTVEMHLRGMSTNLGGWRRHHPHIRAETGWDHFVSLPSGMFRRYRPGLDPRPVYE